MAERAESLLDVHREVYRVAQPEPVVLPADETDSCSATSHLVCIESECSAFAGWDWCC